MSKTNETGFQVIENAARDHGRPGDYMIWEATETRGGVIVTARREGIAHHRDQWGDWCTEGGVHITGGEDESTTITTRRPLTKES